LSIQVQSHSIELALTNTTTRIGISVTNEDGRPVDPKELKLTVMDSSEQALFTDVLYPGPGEVVSPTPSRIVRSGRGLYYFPYGTDNSSGYPATFFGSAPPAPPWDISVNNLLRLSFDSKPFLTVTLTAAIPTAATAAEIIKSINQALVASPNYGELYSSAARFHSVASCASNTLFLTSPLTGCVCESKVEIDQSIVGNAATILFGVIPTTVLVSGNTAFKEVQSLLSNRTGTAGDSLFHWQVTAGQALGSASVLQVVKVASPRAFALLPYFRTEIDKALKSVHPDGSRVGYTDAQLMGYLALAVTEINAYQPITNFTIENFPSRDFMMILIWTATLVALLSQGLFAVDTDIEYSDRGASFRNDHTGKIQGFVSTVTARLEARMQAFKLQFVGVGLVKIEAGANYRLATMLQAAPSGSLFRGLFTGGN